MRFLVDQCLSVDFAYPLADAGHHVVHLPNLDMQPAKDPEVLDLARSQQRVLVSADTDIGTPLAATAAALPSLVLFRRLTGRRHGDQAALLLANLAQLSEALDQGSVTVLEQTPGLRQSR